MKELLEASESPVFTGPPQRRLLPCILWWIMEKWHCAIIVGARQAPCLDGFRIVVFK